MADFLPFIIVGLVNGSVYGLAGMGLVLTYKTSGLFNFSHGALAAGAAYLFYELRDQRRLPWPVAAAICVFVAAPLAGAGIELLARRLTSATTAAKVVATVGLLLATQGLVLATFGAATLSSAPFLPQRAYRIGAVYVGVEQMIIVALTLVAAAGLSLFFRRTRLGIATRGVVDDPVLLGLGGTDPVRIRRRSWIVGTAFAAVSGILLAPAIGLNAGVLTLLVVQAYGAAALGAFSSLPMTYAGGLFLGIAAAISTKYVPDFPSLAGLPSSLPFIVLFVVLLALPKRRLLEAPAAGGNRPRPRRAVAGRQMPLLGTIVAAALIAVPHVVGARVPVYTNFVILALVLLSLRLLVTTSGQVSLCHATFAAVGAATFSHLAAGAGLPWLVALLGAGLVAAPVGAVVAIPAIRLSGLYLAVATFGFGVLLERMVYGTGLMFGVRGGRLAPRPDVAGLGSDTGFYYVCLLALAVGCLVVIVVERTRLGRLLRGLADSPAALMTLGVEVSTTRVLVFCLSAFIAGTAGALLGALTGSVGPQGFGSFTSLVWLCVLAISGSAPLGSAFVAAGLLVLVPAYADSPTLIEYQPVAFGVAAIVAAVASTGAFDVRRRLARWAAASDGRRRRSPVAERSAVGAA
ncbi:MAG: ABC transporter permease [Actinomycetota bacterium]|jgi:branched-subunit amino acid ABC-type transport system permease component